MKRRSVIYGFIGALLGGTMGISPAMAEDITGPSVPVTATVSSDFSFSVTLVEIVNGALGATVSSMDFGTLASNGTSNGQLRSLNSTKAFQAFFGINAQQQPFTIKQTAGPLQNGPNQIANGAFIVTPLDGVGGDPSKPFDQNPPGNMTVKGTRTSAVGQNLVLFSSSGGPSNTMAATYGITDDPALGATEFIPLDQPAGVYTTTITYTATVT